MQVCTSTASFYNFCYDDTFPTPLCGSTTAPNCIWTQGFQLNCVCSNCKWCLCSCNSSSYNHLCACLELEHSHGNLYHFNIECFNADGLGPTGACQEIYVGSTLIHSGTISAECCIELCKISTVNSICDTYECFHNGASQGCLNVDFTKQCVCFKLIRTGADVQTCRRLCMYFNQICMMPGSIGYGQFNLSACPEVLSPHTSAEDQTNPTDGLLYDILDPADSVCCCGATDGGYACLSGYSCDCVCINAYPGTNCCNVVSCIPTCGYGFSWI